MKVKSLSSILIVTILLIGLIFTGFLLFWTESSGVITGEVEFEQVKLFRYTFFYQIIDSGNEDHPKRVTFNVVIDAIATDPNLYYLISVEIGANTQRQLFYVDPNNNMTVLEAVVTHNYIFSTIVGTTILFLRFQIDYNHFSTATYGTLTSLTKTQLVIENPFTLVLMSWIALGGFYTIFRNIYERIYRFRSGKSETNESLYPRQDY